MATQSLRHAIARKWSAQTAEDLEDNLRKIFANLGVLNTAAAAANQSGVLVPSVGDLMACLTTAGAFALLPIVTTDQRAIVNNGGVPGWGQIKLATGVTGTLPLANLVNATVTQRLLGRNTAGAGVFEEVTLTQLLDWIGGATQGDLLYRGAAGWQRLAAGSSGGTQFLQSNGNAADPAWATPTGSGSIADLMQQNFFFVIGRPTTNQMMGVPALSEFGTHATVQITTAAGSFVNFVQTGTTAGLRCGFESGRFDHLESDTDPTFEIILRTPAVITNIRMWFVLCNAAMSSNADDQGGTTQYMGFRFSSVAGDGGWVGVTRDGTTQSVTGTVAALAASTVYRLKVRKSGSTVFFSVNGGAETSTASNLPAAATQLGFALEVYNSVNSVTHGWDFGRLRCYYGA